MASAASLSTAELDINNDDDDDVLEIDNPWIFRKFCKNIQYSKAISDLFIQEKQAQIILMEEQELETKTAAESPNVNNLDVRSDSTPMVNVDDEKNGCNHNYESKWEYVKLKEQQECVGLVTSVNRLFGNGPVRYKVQFKNATHCRRHFFASELIPIEYETYLQASKNFSLCIDMKGSLYNRLLENNDVAAMIQKSNYHVNNPTTLEGKMVEYELVQRLNNSLKRFYSSKHDIRKEIETNCKPLKRKRKKKNKRKNKNDNENTNKNNENGKNENIQVQNAKSQKQRQVMVVITNENESKAESVPQRIVGGGKNSKRYQRKKANLLIKEKKRKEREENRNIIRLECESGNDAPNINIIKFIQDVKLKIKDMNYYHGLQVGENNNNNNNSVCNSNFDINKDIDQKCVYLYEYLRYFGLHYIEKGKKNEKIFEDRDKDADRMIASWLLEQFNKKLKGKYLAFVKYFESRYTSIKNPMERWCVEHSVSTAKDVCKATLRQQLYGVNKVNLRE